ncbi:potassium channel family protein [Chloroflexota bacterium]
MYKKFIWSGVALLVVSIVGTAGYWFVGGMQGSLLDAFYMTIITISTIGFGEIIDLSHNPVGRVFTLAIAVFGMGVLLYFVTNLTAMVVEGELTKSFRRKKMEKMAKNSTDHYIVCGMAGGAWHIIDELRTTKRPHVIVGLNRDNIDKALEQFPDEIFIEGDPTDNSTLLKAGIANAKGLFAVTEDDNQNLVVSLTARQLNPKMRIVARCSDMKNSGKIKKVGADAIISPSFIGGLRMVSEMIRPTAVSFLDMMLKDKELNLRVEDVAVPDSFVGKPIKALNLKKYAHVLLLAVRAKESWIYNPADDYIIQPENTLVFMSTPEERLALDKVFSS